MSASHTPRARFAAVVAAAAALSVGSPALGAGALVQGDGSFLGGPTGDADIASVRALLFQQGDEVTAVVQSAVAAGQTIGSAWILPVPGTIVQEPIGTDPALLDELLRVSDPIYETLGGCSGGCGEAVGDTGTLADVRFFDETKASANWTRFGPTAVGAAIESLESSGFAVSAPLAADLQAHADTGGGFVVVWFTGDRTGSASPAIVVRYRASQLVLPQALTRNSADTEVQTAVLTLGSGPTRPTDIATTTPTLGVPLYDDSRTPEFYQARVRVAIDAAGGDAWVLEYANTLDSLVPRGALLTDEDVLWDDTSGVPWSGLHALVSRGALDDFNPSEVWISRWRTFQKPDSLRDQPFAFDDSVGAYEVYVPASEFGAAAWVWTAPFLLVGWAARRRRRHT